MARTLTTSRLRRYVGGLAALSAARPEPVDRPARARPALRRMSRSEPSARSEPEGSEAKTQALARVERLIGRLDWARAQRLLEDVTRRDHDRELRSYLEEVRAVRRAQRQLMRRPRDAALHIELGRLYFGLELGDQAAAEFSRAIELEPTLVDGHFYLALEYMFRGEEKASRELSLIHI